MIFTLLLLKSWGLFSFSCSATFDKAKQEFLWIVLLIIHQFENVLMNKELLYDYIIWKWINNVNKCINSIIFFHKAHAMLTLGNINFISRTTKELFIHDKWEDIFLDRWTKLRFLGEIIKWIEFFLA